MTTSWPSIAYRKELAWPYGGIARHELLVSVRAFDAGEGKASYRSCCILARSECLSSPLELL